MGWKDKLDKGLQVASEISNVALMAMQAKHPLGILAVGLRGWSAYRELEKKTLEQLMASYPHYLDLGVLMEYLKEYSKDAKADQVSKEATLYRVALGGGVELAWAKSQRGDTGIYANRHKNELEGLIGRRVWDGLGVDQVLLTANPSSWGVKILPDPLAGDFESQTAKQVWDRLSRFLSAGMYRSVLLYGPPGTGKSQIARQLIKFMGGKSIRIITKDIFRVLYHVEPMLKWLKPNVLFIDDLDRSFDRAGTLGMIDAAKNHVPLIVATANDISKMTTAEIRPGRFDDLVEIKHLDSGVVDKLVGNSPIAEALRDLPVAYIDAFRQIREAIGEESALAEVQALRNRFEAFGVVAKKEGEAK